MTWYKGGVIISVWNRNCISPAMSWYISRYGFVTFRTAEEARKVQEMVCLSSVSVFLSQDNDEYK